MKNKDVAEWLHEIASKIETLEDPEKEFDPEVFDFEMEDLEKIIQGDFDGE